MSQAGIINVIENNPSIPTTFDANVGSATPIFNILNILGAVVAAGSNPVRTAASGNTVTTQVQISQAIPGTDATKIGLAAFNNTQFTVDGNGFVSLAGGGLAIDSITANSGDNPVTPDSNGNVSIVGTGSITTVASLNTETIQLTGLTNHNVLVGAGTATITKVAPSATSGVPLISQGASADPIFGTAVVAGGGTGVTSTTAYGVICGGTTTTGALQNAGAGSSGQVLVSNGVSALPTWQAVSAVEKWVLIQTQTANNSATIDFTTGITSTYTNYVFVLSNVVPANNNVVLTMVVSVNGGSSYITTNYTAGDNLTQYNSNTWVNSNTTAAMVITGGIANSDPGLSGQFWLSNITTAKPPVCNWNTMQWNGVRMSLGASYNTTTSGVNAFRWAFGSGNIVSGNFSLYGIRSS